MTQETDQDTRSRLLKWAKEFGADAADCVAIRSRSVDVSVLKGNLEDAEGSENFGIGLRVFKGKRSAYGSSADDSDAGLKALAEQICAMSGAVPEDAHSRLATESEMANAWDDLDLVDPADEPGISSLQNWAQEIESSALGVEGITNSDGASAGWSKSFIGISNTSGFDGAYAHTGSYASVSVIGGTGDAMERDYASTQATFAGDLENLDTVGKRAAERTLSRLHSKQGKTGTFPVIFDKRVSASLLRSLARCLYGPRQAKGTSFLCDALGKAVCHESISIIDDPLMKRGHRSGPFDAECLPVMRRSMVEGGVLNHLFLDLRSAARLGMQPTGHATRGLSSAPSPSPANLWIMPGESSRASMIADIKEGFLVTELMGSSISLTSGDYSRGASGFWIENGEIAYAVSEMTIAGNLKDMFLSMMPADDLEHRSGIDAPSLLIPAMTVAGQ